ncbi:MULTISPECIES: hypothetical protein [Burkholderia]|uniref:Uncharacterized protein n=1 Tax=Burkholderia pyrrocinia TaxID=60550 RepID=A0A318J487_BURPY|nr:MULTISPECIES: hypothetical protein [Burkholderia]PXX41127.1 hypothetical protein NA66_1001737 [Burkholderia pyrrocinia]SFW58519.1 hypothetical protein SAMN03159384_03052 [Burkholderia sp. NFACC33-1]SFY12040.1 hypothetical protein SAMN03159408_03264 [Burkholderia sp. NFPP32]
MSEKKTGLQRLREPFPEHQISLLPKPYKRDSPKGKCSECGGWHGLPAVHLSYVGHAALTDRLLECDENWSWEPLALGPDGLPLLDRDGGMWIRLTVCGVTRLGYGDAQGKTGPDATKERIGDALRNAAMRFGAALDLWHKGDLHGPEEGDGEENPQVETPHKGLAASSLKTHVEAIKKAPDMNSLKSLHASAYKAAHAVRDTVAEEIINEAKDARKLELEEVTS